jgi:fatty-acyl-CoA synthase
MDADGWISIRDRSKDVIKSGGEWISSVALETTLLGHPSVAEAMVVGLAHPQWGESPLALVVRREGCDCTPEDLLAHLAPHFPRWWMPTGFEFVSTLPRTSVGKLDKKVTRQEYAGYFTSAPSIGYRTEASKRFTMPS